MTTSVLEHQGYDQDIHHGHWPVIILETQLEILQKGSGEVDEEVGGELKLGVDIVEDALCISIVYS